MHRHLLPDGPARSKHNSFPDIAISSLQGSPPPTSRTRPGHTHTWQIALHLAVHFRPGLHLKPRSSLSHPPPRLPVWRISLSPPAPRADTTPPPPHGHARPVPQSRAPLRAHVGSTPSGARGIPSARGLPDAPRDSPNRCSPSAHCQILNLAGSLSFKF